MPNVPTVKSLANKLAKMETKLSKCATEIKSSKQKLKECTSELKVSKRNSIDNASKKKLKEKLKGDKPKRELNAYMIQLKQARQQKKKQFTYTKKNGEKVTFVLDEKGFPSIKK